MEEDLVCNICMDIEMIVAASEYEGKTYYFCSFSCKKAFDDEPMKYVGRYND